MTPEEARGRMLFRRSLVGMIWFLVEWLVLGMVIRLVQNGDTFAAWAVGTALILLSYMEGRFRK